MNTQKFKKIVWSHYKYHKRDLPWRKTRDPYKILVSEIMLQQTQVSRVVLKYTSFLKKFPTVQILAKATVKQVVGEWHGLGYSRRALYLKRTAEIIVQDYNGKFPKDFDDLCKLPGVGKATAGDIMAFAWNMPIPVIETNIRSVYIHFFFKDKKQISDTDILSYVEKTLDHTNPREWYWALFDYGFMLKKEGNPNQKSKHYIRQSKFEGSFRQKRAKVLQALLQKPMTQKEITQSFSYPSILISHIASLLTKEGFIERIKNKYQVKI